MTEVGNLRVSLTTWLELRHEAKRLTLEEFKAIVERLAMEIESL